MERVSTTSQDRKQLIVPQATDFAVDWLTEAVYFVYNSESIIVTNFNVVDEKSENVNIQLYRTQNYSYVISTLSVDPASGLVPKSSTNICLF